IAESIAMENRLVGKNHVFQMLERRDKVEKLLKDFKVDEFRINEVVKPIDKMITFDLFHDLLSKAHYNVMGQKKIPWVEDFNTNIRDGIDIDITEFSSKLEESDFFKRLDIKNELNLLEYFLSNHSLPPN
ncbi:hypothetical protein ACFL6P_06525, partial [Candidatus Latescibacterota bacterium]